MRKLRKGESYALLRSVIPSQFKDAMLRQPQSPHSTVTPASQSSRQDDRDKSHRVIKNIQIRVIGLILFFVLYVLFSDAQAQSGRILGGEVRSAANGLPIEGVSVTIGKKYTLSDKEGKFSVTVAEKKGILNINHIGYNKQSVAYDETTTSVEIILQPSDNQIEEVEVISTGYQNIPKERATGSFEVIGKDKLNISKGGNIISRLEGLSPSLRFEKRIQGLNPLQQLTVRGTSTFYGFYNPLVILDNFPYEGDINSINPNDIEQVTILKDAAAASIWGTRAGSGVIVLTSKKAGKDGRLKLGVNISSQVGEKPDIYKMPYMSSSSFMEMEEFLFNNKFYDWQINAPDRTISPMVALLNDLRKGAIDSAEYHRSKDGWSKNDVRNDYMKYVYRPSFNQLYAINLSGGNKQMDYFASVGIDKNRNNIQSSNYERISSKLMLNLRPIERVEINMQMIYGDNTTKNVGTDSQISFGSLYSGGGRSFYPYLRLVDDLGNGIDLETVTVRKSYMDTLAGGRLLPAPYNIFNEMEASQNKARTQDMTFNIGTKVDVLPGLNGQLSYQYQQSGLKISNWQGFDSYYTRRYTNTFTEWTANTLINNVPIGDILNQTNGKITAHYFRGTMAYDNEFDDGRHKISALTGGEVKDLNDRSDAYNLYGYDKETLGYKRVNYATTYRLLNGVSGSGQIHDGVKFEELNQRFLSVFANMSYTYNNRYILSASFRKDASNLFGVKTNDKWQPLWSSGIAWDIAKEPFFKSSLFSKLKLRSTFGYNGNANSSFSAQPIMEYSGTHSITGLPYAYMVSPSNPTYRSERVGIFNIGADFSSRSNRVHGTLDFYLKDGRDVVARSMLDPTTGFESQIVNLAHFAGKGVEANINTTNIMKDHFTWQTNFIFNYHRNITRKYNYKSSRADSYMGDAYTPNPVEGRDLYGLYAYAYAGLDPATGEPQGWMNGEISKNYNQFASGPVEDLRFMGSTVPLYSGYFRNTFRYKQLSLSTNLQYRFKFVFRRESVNYSGLANYWTMHQDFEDRWQQPGDEQRTDVPAFIFPVNNSRDSFYAFSDVLVERGDAIRIKDVNLSYALPNMRQLKLNASLFFNVDNMNIMVWKKTKYPIDPDFHKMIPTPRIYTFGLSVNM
ncbi:SusC/RagA family TonB-linked outer membrane protein [Sphingobacterium olei]|uniref:SusC/RagA family TonB-linked outer membrane protein n=1 Tax=Sphingobacterium olei TaxID=2571155 RepID=A0A4U0N9D1_9SPHI|nr:SusC/RagA family TonB-linked outer membrane protein [Sphingobacterium olei]TJZ50062.1 SusC/RagA family TonB-linked outer membrane protein [Sphingobacterium olei]